MSCCEFLIKDFGKMCHLRRYNETLISSPNGLTDLTEIWNKMLDLLGFKASFEKKKLSEKSDYAPLKKIIGYVHKSNFAFRLEVLFLKMACDIQIVLRFISPNHL